MPFELVEEDQMAKKSRKTISIKPEIKKQEIGIPIIRNKEIEGDVKEYVIKGDEVKEVKKEIKGNETKESGIKGIKKDISLNPDIIVKKIYFPADTYSKNQKEFKNILADYNLYWIKGMWKTYVSNKGVKIVTGMYGSSDQTKKVLCIYEGSEKPMTAIVKVIGTGGKFLIDLISFSNRIGCTIEDKDDVYANNVQLTLKEKGEIYVDKKLEEEKIENFQEIFEEKIKKFVDERLNEYLDAYKSSFERRGISIDTVIFFKKKEIEENVRWGLENGLVKI
jgi:hypothetical protein